MNPFNHSSRHLRLLPFLLTIIFPLSALKAENKQNEHKIDSLTGELKKATDPVAKFELYKALSTLETPPTKKYKSDLLLNAELSGSTELQLRTYLLVAELAGEDSMMFY